MRALRQALPLLAILLAAGPCRAFEPSLPAGARLTAERLSELDSFDAPVGVFEETAVPSMSLEGRVLRRSWRIEAPGLTPLQVMVPLRQQLGAQGYRVIFECAAVTCGGFDFRFGIEVLPGPNMFVNIVQFRYLTAIRGAEEAPESVASLLVSVTSGSAYVQIVTVETGPAGEASPPRAAPLDVAAVPPESETAVAAVSGEADVRWAEEFEALLFAQGRVVLEDLDFATGSTSLGAGPFASLEVLADILARRETLRLALVGHTDATGDLAVNIDVSRARAQSVLDRLVDALGADAARLDAQGMGYLAPVASNLSEEGRARNRRVEAIIVSEG